VRSIVKPAAARPTIAAVIDDRVHQGLTKAGLPTSRAGATRAKSCNLYQEDFRHFAFTIKKALDPISLGFVESSAV
jgi:hypothetical protein